MLPSITNITEPSLSTKLMCIAISLFLLLDMLMPQYANYWFLFLLICNGVYILMNRKMLVQINNTGIILIIFFALSLLGLLFSDGVFVGGSQRYIISLFIGIVNYIILISMNKWDEYLLKLIMIICVIFMVASLVQLINPNIIIQINRVLQLPEHFQSSYNFINNGYLTGITNNPGINGFVISIFIIFLYVSLLNSVGKIKKIILSLMIIFSIYFLLLTTKRGFLIFVILIILYLSYRMTRNKAYSVGLILLATLIAGVFIFATEAGQGILMRSIMQDDITSGRSGPYIVMWEDFLESPLFGKGTYTTNNVVSIYNGHNIYLQLLREQGIVGFLVFMTILVSNLFRTDYLIKNAQTRTYRVKLGYSISLQLLFILWGVTGNPLYDVFPLMFYFVGIALSWKLQNEECLYKKSEAME